MPPHRAQTRAHRARVAFLALTLGGTAGGCSLALDWNVSHLPAGMDASLDGDAGPDAGDARGPDGDGAGPEASSCPGADLSTDPDHCGRCEVQCPGTACRMGQCTNDCLLGRLDCDGNVVNGCEVVAATDTDHCGACNNACRGASGMCCNGACQRTCP